MEGNDKVDEVIVDPSVGPSIQINTFRPQTNANPNTYSQQFHQNATMINPAQESSKPLQETMLPK